MTFEKITEADSYHNDLEKKSISELLDGMHQEDQNAIAAVGAARDQTAALIARVVEQLSNGGRLFYIGAGTSGRLGVLDASECPPTFGTAPEKVIGLIAGGDLALRKSIEKAEDDTQQAWKDLQEYQITTQDILVGIAASGTTPYVVGGLAEAQKQGIPTGCIACNVNSPLAAVSDFPIEVVVGPEFLTGSSRMKAGTAQKLILNSITTATMIHDPTGTCQRQQNGGHAAFQRQTPRPCRTDGYGSHRCRTFYCSKTTSRTRQCPTGDCGIKEITTHYPYHNTLLSSNLPIFAQIV
jgi:N-acetylmuramic acid 6-phosphate etherase